jgi:transcriptional regulator GlxA family with amidase domain
MGRGRPRRAPGRPYPRRDRPRPRPALRRAGAARPRLRRVAAGLRADPASPRRLEEWAEVAGASPRTLERLFLSETGMGFARWRQRLRLAEAAARLARGEAPARPRRRWLCQRPAFGAAFRAAFGITPGGAR